MPMQWIWNRKSNRWFAIIGLLLWQSAQFEPMCLGQVLEGKPACSRCNGDGECVHRLTDYPAFENKTPNPSRLLESCDDDCQGNAFQRWKRGLQSSHWGYPEYFHGNTFGIANRHAFSANIRDGAIERSTLYQMDFYPEDSPRSQMLTPRGLERLQRALCVNQAYGGGLRFEQATHSELTQLRRAWLAEHPEVLGAGITFEQIRPIGRAMGIQATEAVRRYQQGLSSSLGVAQGSLGPGAGASGGFSSSQGTGATSGGSGR